MITRRYGRKAAARRRSGGQTILVSAYALLLCLIGIAGCSSSPGNNASSGSDNNAGNASPAASPSGCFLTGSVRPGHKSRIAGQPVLASARLASYEAPLPVIVPHADYNFDEVRPAGQDEQQQTDWAHQGLDYAQSHPQEMPGTLEPTKANLQIVASAVKSREESTLLTDDLGSGDMAGYGAEICRAIALVDHAITNLNDVNQVVSYLQQLATNDNSQAPNDLAGVVQDTYNQFANDFESCVSDISSTQWIFQELQSVFCPGELSGRSSPIPTSSWVARSGSDGEVLAVPDPGVGRPDGVAGQVAVSQ